MKEFVKVVGVRNVNGKVIDEEIKYIRIDSIDMFKFVSVTYRGIRYLATEICCPYGTFITLENTPFTNMTGGEWKIKSK